jgi:hypothetical protein
MKVNICIFLLAIFFLVSCESEQAKLERLKLEEQEQVEAKKQILAIEKADALRLEKEQADKQKQELENSKLLEEKRIEQELYDKYINNSLRTGATPYAQYYGANSSCYEEGCSKIEVTTSNSDVLVTIKRNDRVVRHAFINGGDSFTFSFPNGTYQAFFYYGKGWNPEKEMKNGELSGGFISEESFGKDDPQSLYNNILRYELIMQQNGNFSTRPSNSEEAL